MNTPILQPTELRALAPLLVLAATVVAELLLVAFRRDDRGALPLAAAGLVGALGALAASPTAGSLHIAGLLELDGTHRLLTVVLIGAALATVVLLRDRRARAGPEARTTQEDRLAPAVAAILVLLATLGGLVLAGSVHVATLFLGLEILSLSLIGLVAIPRRSETLEAAFKYLILGAVGSAFLLLGAAFVYGATGTLELGSFVSGFAPAPGAVFLSAGKTGGLAVAGVLLVLVAVGFKLGLVPFHFWTPEVYRGAPAPVTAFLASASKAAVVAAVLRLGLPGDEPAIFGALAAMAIASMVVGNLLALLEDDVQRLLAYSSIAHLGYLLVALLAGGRSAERAVLFYLVAYALTIFVAFAVISILATDRGEPAALEDFTGLAWRRPGLATGLGVALISLAGLPLTAGFFGKIFVLGEGVASQHWVLVGTLAATSVAGLFAYLRVLAALIAPAEPEAVATPRPTFGLAPTVLAGLVVLLVVTGIYPSWLLEILGP